MGEREGKRLTRVVLSNEKPQRRFLILGMIYQEILRAVSRQERTKNSRKVVQEHYFNRELNIEEDRAAFFSIIFEEEVGRLRPVL